MSNFTLYSLQPQVIDARFTVPQFMQQHDDNNVAIVHTLRDVLDVCLCIVIDILLYIVQIEDVQASVTQSSIRMRSVSAAASYPNMLNGLENILNDNDLERYLVCVICIVK
jgi:hypothetical protein